MMISCFIPSLSVVYLAKRCAFLLLLLCMYGCQSAANKPNIRVAAAASVQFALEALIADYESKESIHIDAVIASSGKLTAQIIQGAPYDLFLSADTSYPNYIYQKQKCLQEPVIYGQGQLVLWSSERQIKPLKIDFLKDPSINKIALADPNTAPFGQLSVQFLQQQHLWQQLGPKLVFGESIAQVNQYVSTQAVDIGLTSLSIVLSEAAADKGSFLPLPYYIPQSMVLLANKKGPKDASLQFYRYLQSQAAKKILKAYGLK